MNSLPPNTVVLGITGASGAPLALSLFRELALHPLTVHLVFSDVARELFAEETGVAPQIAALIAGVGDLRAHVEMHANDDFSAPIASGAYRWQAMVVCPASMNTLSRIASGAADNLITRAADVTLKERRQLILVPRETPLSAVHLENMLKLARLGAALIPPMLGFYFHPESLEDEINFVVGKVLDHLGVEHMLHPRGGERS